MKILNQKEIRKKIHLCEGLRVPDPLEYSPPSQSLSELSTLLKGEVAFSHGIVTLAAYALYFILVTFLLFRGVIIVW